MKKSANKTKMVIILIITNLFMLFWFLSSLYLSYVLLISNPKESIAFIYYSSVMHIITVFVFWVAVNYLVITWYRVIMSISLLSEKSEKTSEELKKLTNRN